MNADPRPVLFVTNYAPAFRVPSFAALHVREDVVFALVGGAVRHGGGTVGPAEPFPVVRVPQRAAARLATSQRFRAVIAGLSGRVAPLAAYAGARAAGVPFVLWATLWRHPRTAAHALTYLPVRHLYRHADAIATYGPHVSAYVRAAGAAGPVVEAPQAADAAFWSAPAEPERRAPFQVLFAGRLKREKGVHVLLEAWRACGPDAALLLYGDGPLRGAAAAAGALTPGPVGPAQLRNSYAGSDVVVVPSIATREFLEPWGMVVNEAFHQGVPVIASTAVGAVAGGLVVHERTGLVVAAGDPGALARALRRLHDDPALRERLGAAGRAAAAAFTPAAWAAGMSRALASVGASRLPKDAGGGC